ncbi:MAG: hypothetical protein IJ337_04965, partial [Clostridia bacterium]|nr:hypothetical protein [Clostridia bacterium]
MWMLASLLLTVICLCGILRKRFEEMLAPVSMTAILVLYVLSFEQRMLWFPAISYATAALAVGAIIWRGARTRGAAFRDLFAYSVTPGMAAVAILPAVLFPVSMNQIVLVSADIRFWGLQA